MEELSTEDHEKLVMLVGKLLVNFRELSENPETIITFLADFSINLPSMCPNILVRQ